ncbi:xylose reductase [Rhodotorula graminis WP1]|uniref:Xylose reductase n=1 Tax=Rhodotorula graminis (strain WP1) TaxID=578459 RepID=A0A0P9ESV5_RHOGW|nr:xylose reductase [Rhodotorula graminis WP1]KPV72356.1 xylose reductase [Rhodotorula graminis WP1]
MVQTVPTFKLSTGAEFPLLGFGTWQAPDEEVKKAVAVALKAGYRHLDLAKVYQNQKAIAPAIADSGVPRSEIFITSKLWCSQHNPSLVEAALDDTLKELGLEYLDLYLIHWPVAFAAEGNPHDNLFPKENGEVKIDTSVSVVDTWKAMIKLLDTGKTKAIGVSNFSIEAIDAITKATGVAPAVHQVERHPRLLQRELIKHHKANNIALTAYSGFGNNNIGEPLLLTHPTVKKIAEQKGADAGQVLIAWGMHGGHAIIPKSVTESRIISNFKIVELSEDDIAAIDAIGDESKGGSYKRFNVPVTYNPKWPINVFNEKEEQGEKYSVNLGN